MLGKRRQYLEFTVDADGLLHQTPSAVILKIGGEEVWIPKSQIEDHDDGYESIIIPEWLAIEKGIESYGDPWE